MEARATLSNVRISPRKVQIVLDLIRNKPTDVALATLALTPKAASPILEKLVKSGQKKFVRYEEGKMLYSMGLHSFQEIAKEAGAVYHVKRMVLVNVEKVDRYLENFCDEL